MAPWPDVVGRVEGFGHPDTERTALRRVRDTRLDEADAARRVALGVILDGTVEWLEAQRRADHRAGVVWTSALALERALLGEICLMGALLAGVASLVPPDRVLWSTCFRRFEGDHSPLADVFEQPLEWAAHQRNEDYVDELLYQVSVAIRDQIRLVDATQPAPLTLDLSLSLRRRNERVTVRAQNGTYEVLRPGPPGLIDLRFSWRGLLAVAGREVHLPELIASGELVASGEIADAVYLSPRF